MNLIHFWQFHDNSCIKIETDFMKPLLEKIIPEDQFFYVTAKQMKVNESLLREIKQNPSRKIELKTLRKIVKFAQKRRINISLNDFENHITWFGYRLGRGIHNPKLPFRLNKPAFSTILSASLGDGTITNRSGDSFKYTLGSFQYWNEKKEIRENVIDAAIVVFGGNESDYKIRPNRNSFVIFFPAIIRDLLLMSGSVQGEKSIINPKIPNQVKLSKQNNINWLRQAFDDEGSVRHRTRSNHEVYLTRVVDINYGHVIGPKIRINFNKLLEDLKNKIRKNPPALLAEEGELLEKLGINCKIIPQEIYSVKKAGRLKAKWRLYITRKNNIKKFAEIIGFSSPRKSKILSKIVDEKNAIYTESKRKSLGRENRESDFHEMVSQQNLRIQFEKHKSEEENLRY